MFTGCGNAKKEVTAYVEEQLKDIGEDSGIAEQLLEQGIEETKGDYVLAFPKESREEYVQFLQSALGQVEFKVKEAEEAKEGTYRVRVTFEAIDVGNTVREANEAYAKEMQSAEFGTELMGILKKDRELLKDAVRKSPSNQVIEVKKSGDDLQIQGDTMDRLVQKLLSGYMVPYELIADAFDERDFLQAYLDATFKGELEQFCKHTEKTMEEAAAWYEESFKGMEDMGFTGGENQRMINAFKTIFKNSKYIVGAPKLTSAFNYSVEVTITPNMSLKNATTEFEAGTYKSEREVKNAAINLYEKYAANPAYGEEVTVVVPLNLQTYLEKSDENSELWKLMNQIIPN